MVLTEKECSRRERLIVGSKQNKVINMRKVYGILNLRDTWVVAESTRKSMQGNTSAETGPEIALRKGLWAAGLRGYRKNVKGLPGRPDVVYGKARLAVFVHGCYWHGCPNCTRNLKPKTNMAYWSAKVESNQARDARNTEQLRARGCRVLVVWECELKKGGVEEVVERVREALKEPL